MTDPVRTPDRRDVLRQSLETIERLQRRLAASEAARHESIAIVGMGCRYPGAADPDAFWELLKDGRDAVREVPADRWDVNAYFDADPAAVGKTTSRTGAFLERVDLFDARFFGIAPREAATLDPQQRLLLEVAWETLDDAVIAPDRLSGSSTGVFVGITTSDYARQLDLGSANGSDVYAATGNALNAAAGRIAFVLGLQGPCMAIDTACSSSLVAVHEACQALRAGECDLALAGGVNVMLSPVPSILFAKWGMLASDGRVKAFDAAADGFVRGEGCGMVALRRLSDAEADGNRILAVIRGSAVNSDGRSSGLTVPNGPAQRKVIQRALEMARIAGADVDYVEAHGTGTPLGDPIEVEALGATLCVGRPASRPLLLGGVKANIGHTESASGVAGLIKVVLALRANMLPRQLHFTAPNPRIMWGDGTMRVVREDTAWLRGERDRVAGVSSFGFSGTNAHVVLGDAPARPARSAAVERPAHVLMLSARTPAALRTLVIDLRDRLRTERESVADIAFSLAVGRARHAERLALVATDASQAAAELTAYLDGDHSLVHTGRAEAGHAPRHAWLFTGQGAQWSGMGRELYDAVPVFRDAVHACAAVLDPLRLHALTDVMFGAASVPGGLLDETLWTQPALFTLEYALACMLRNWGIVPTAVAGHSLGEYVAATVAGVLPLDAALTLVARRAELMQALPTGGAMVAIDITEASATALAEVRTGALAVAAVNGPSSVVLSGAADIVTAVSARCESNGARVNRLVVSHAFHSVLMEPVLQPLERALTDLPFAEPTVPLMTNLTGRPARDGELSSPKYWLQQLRGTVRFADALRSLAAAGCDTFVEVGPHPVLLGMARDTVGGSQNAWLPLLRRGKSAWPSLLEMLAEHFVRGGTFDAQAFDAPFQRSRVSVPGTVFERSRHWIDAAPLAPRASQLVVPAAGTQLLGPRQPSPVPGAQFSRVLDSASPSFVADHVIFGVTLLPGTAFVEIGLEAAHAVGLGTPVTIEGLELAAPLPLTVPAHVHVMVEPMLGGSRVVRVTSAPVDDAGGDAWREHAVMRVRAGAAEGGAPTDSVAIARARCSEAIDTDLFYSTLASAGLRFGPVFRCLRELWVGATDAVGRVQLADAPTADDDAMLLHPALLDACFHVIGARLAHEHVEGEADDVYLPVAIDAVTLLGPMPSHVYCAVTLRTAPEGQAGLRDADVRIETMEGEVVAIVRGLRLRRATAGALHRAVGGSEPQQTVARVTWVPLSHDVDRQTVPQQITLVADDVTSVTELVIQLTSRGVRCAVVPGSALLSVDASSLTSAVSSANRHDQAHWVVLCCARESARSEWYAEARAQYAQLLHLGQALLGHSAVGLAVVTSAAISANDRDRPVLSLASLPGLARTIATERDDSPALRLDLGPDDALTAELLLAALAVSGDTPEVVWREERLLAPRLDVIPAVTAHRHTRRALQISERGTLDKLTLVDETRRTPSAGEVEIAVRAAGLNFRDVLNVLGMYPGDPGPLGSECSGVVTAVGAGVTDLAVGDAVVAFASDSFSTHAIAEASLTLRLPDALGFEAAASLPNAYVTAAWALRAVANVRPGQCVLVHAAMGGVGLAAMRLARAAGATVIATAGSTEKRERALGEGASHAFDSRSVSFADDVLRVTQGRGVDVVVNSLAGDLVAAGMRVVVDGGCFVEIGKNGIWTAEDAAVRAPHVRYVVVDLGVEIQRDVHAVRRLFAGLVDDVAAGRLAPLPIERFALEDAQAAFRHMAMARHVGKIVLVPEALKSPDRLTIRADATYVVTGGLGGLGLAAAEWLVERGARTLVLLGRHAPSVAADGVLVRLREHGVQLLTPAVDVSDASALRTLWRDTLASLPPVRGIVHAAGVTSDATLAMQDIDRFDRVAAAKVIGTWNLHEVSAQDTLDFFVLFSSSSALFGSPGQAPYAATNAFLDAFAAWRRASGLVATSFGWGAWGGVGMARSVPDATRRRWMDAGIGQLDPTDALDAMARHVRGPDALLEVFSIDRSRMLARANTAMRSLFGSTAHAETRPPHGSAPLSSRSVVAALQLAPAADRFSQLRAHVRSQVCAVLGLSASAAPDDGHGLFELGIDSLMATELRTRLQQSLQTSLPSTLAFEYPTIGALTTYLIALLDFAAEPIAVAAVVDDLAGTSDDDIARLLDEELNQAGF